MIYVKSGDMWVGGGDDVLLAEFGVIALELCKRLKKKGTFLAPESMIIEMVSCALKKANEEAEHDTGTTGT